MKGYCPNCDQDRSLSRLQRAETFEIRGESIRVRSTVLICTHCKSSVSDPDLDEKTIREAYDQYRRRHQLLFPHQIRPLRQAYGLSQRGLSRLLGWSEATIQRYEKGALQDEAHDVVLRSLDDPHFVLQMLNRHRDRIPRREQEQIEQKASRLIGEKREPRLLREATVWEQYVSRNKGGGNTDFDVSKFADTVLWFAHRDRKLFKTKLAKLLWLSDFAHYLRYNRSITGLVYVSAPNGPMPNDFTLLLGVLDATRTVQLEVVEFAKYQGEIVVPVQELQGTLKAHEVETLQSIFERFGRYQASQLSKLSHDEAVWRRRQPGEVIPYSEARRVALLQNLSTS